MNVFRIQINKDKYPVQYTRLANQSGASLLNKLR